MRALSLDPRLTLSRSFDLLVRRQIARLEQPGLQCVDLVFDELQRMALQCETTELTRFPELRDRVVDVVNSMLRSCIGPTQQMISNLIKIELAHINTSHPDFIGGSRAVAQLMDRVPDDTRPPMVSETVPVAAVSEPPSGPPGRRPSGAAGRDTASTNPFAGFFGGKKKDGAQGDEVVTLPQVPETMRRVGASPSERERIETEIIKSLISSYFDIVRKNWMDLVPKACMHFMVKHAKENMQTELVSKLYKEDLLSEVMRETPEVAQRRQEIQEMRTLLHRALEIVNEVGGRRARARSTASSISRALLIRAPGSQVKDSRDLKA